MTGHVAQFFIADADWHDALTAIRGALRRGGTFAFEGRHPQVQAWKTLTPSRTRRTILDPVLGPIETWVAEANASGGVVETVAPYRFADSELLLPGVCPGAGGDARIAGEGGRLHARWCEPASTSRRRFSW